MLRSCSSYFFGAYLTYPKQNTHAFWDSDWLNRPWQCAEPKQLTKPQMPASGDSCTPSVDVHDQPMGGKLYKIFNLATSCADEFKDPKIYASDVANMQTTHWTIYRSDENPLCLDRDGDPDNCVDKTEPNWSNLALARGYISCDVWKKGMGASKIQRVEYCIGDDCTKYFSISVRNQSRMPNSPM